MLLAFLLVFVLGCCIGLLAEAFLFSAREYDEAFNDGYLAGSRDSIPWKEVA